MSASQIPNLNTLRRGGPRSRGRSSGRGGGGRLHPGLRGNHSPPDPQGDHRASSLSSARSPPPPPPPPPSTIPLTKDDIIRRTDTDASTSRLSAVETGYLDDPFAKGLIGEEGGGNGEGGSGGFVRRLPLMNRGTYVRTTAIDRLVDTFISSNPKRRKQIISLGAGSDTRFFRLRRKYGPDGLNLVYHEIDFEENTRVKISLLRNGVSWKGVAERLAGWKYEEEEARDKGAASTSRGTEGEEEGAEVMDPNPNNTTSLHTPDYHIHALDLRSLPGASLHSSQRTTATETTMSVASHLDPSLATLLISECCLIYLSPTDASAVLTYFASFFPPSSSLGIVIYEPIRPHDAFGRTMVANLTARGIHLQTLNSHATLGAQRKRLKDHGLGPSGSGRGASDSATTATAATATFGGVGAADVDFIYREWIDEKEKERVEGLEWMDELEEWRLLMRHYCVVWGWRNGRDGPDGGGGGGSSSSSSSSTVDRDRSREFEGWRQLKGQPGDD